MENIFFFFLLYYFGQISNSLPLEIPVYVVNAIEKVIGEWIEKLALSMKQAENDAEPIVSHDWKKAGK